MDSTTSVAAVIEKIKKLLKLSKSDNVNEAATAASQAQRLMDEYRVSAEALQEAREPITEAAEPLDGDRRGTRVVPWKLHLAAHISKSNGCATLVQGSALLMIGRESDAAVSRYLYAFCVHEITRLAKRDAKGKGAAYINQYRLGCVGAILEKLGVFRQSQRDLNPAARSALVITNARYEESRAYARAMQTSKRPKRRLGRIDVKSAAFNRGFRTARDEIELRRGVPSNTDEPVTPDTHRLGGGSP